MLLPQKIIDDIQSYKENLIKFLAGEIEDSFFRGIRVPWGFYSQRGGNLLMARLRIPAGIMTPQQLKHIGIAAKNFATGNLHITTRQDIQIHNVPDENSIKILEYLKDCNISPRGGGGNTIRNITCCYLSGICPAEHVEVYKLVWALSEYLLSLDESYRLPRKIKIAFSGCEQDCNYAGINDIGFVALRNGFKVLCGGGLGAKSSVGKVLQENVDPREVGYIAKSIVNVFNRYGERKNRHHNRLRFFIQDTGWQRFVELYHAELNKLHQEGQISLVTKAALPRLTESTDTSQKPKILENDDQALLNRIAGRQKQAGHFYVTLRVPLGEIDAESLVALAGLADSIPALMFRTTPRQDLIISNVPNHRITHVYEKIKTLIKDLKPWNVSPDIICCKGATTCNLGICNSMGLTSQILRELSNIHLAEDTIRDLKININGCPNACGQHPIGMVSLSGIARKVHNRSVPFYKIYLGGKPDAENTQLAKQTGMVPAYAVPQLLTEFLSVLQENKHENVYQYITNQGRILMQSLIEKYSPVPPYEENINYYRDFGKTEEFSLDGLSQGECGAGVIDMIESDLKSAAQSLTRAKERGLDLNEISRVLMYSARALLVTKGVDPQNETEVIVAFIDRFIKTGISDTKFGNLKQTYEKILIGTMQKKVAYAFVKDFLAEVKEIYALMDAGFEFPVRFQKEPKPKAELLPPAVTQSYDLRGTPCPINYVKSKLKLEELHEEEILEIYLDDGEPIQSVPKSLANDGQEIVKIEKVKDFFKVTVRKKV